MAAHGLAVVCPFDPPTKAVVSTLEERLTFFLGKRYGIRKMAGVFFALVPDRMLSNTSP